MRSFQMRSFSKRSFSMKSFSMRSFSMKSFSMTSFSMQTENIKLRNSNWESQTENLKLRPRRPRIPRRPQGRDANRVQDANGARDARVLGRSLWVARLIQFEFIEARLGKSSETWGNATDRGKNLILRTVWWRLKMHCHCSDTKSWNSCWLRILFGHFLLKMHFVN